MWSQVLGLDQECKIWVKARNGVSNFSTGNPEVCKVFKLELTATCRWGCELCKPKKELKTSLPSTSPRARGPTITLNARGQIQNLTWSSLTTSVNQSVEIFPDLEPTPQTGSMPRCQAETSHLTDIWALSFLFSQLEVMKGVERSVHTYAAQGIWFKSNHNYNMSQENKKWFFSCTFFFYFAYDLKYMLSTALWPSYHTHFQLLNRIPWGRKLWI